MSGLESEPRWWCTACDNRWPQGEDRICPHCFGNQCIVPEYVPPPRADRPPNTVIYLADWRAKKRRG